MGLSSSLSILYTVILKLYTEPSIDASYQIAVHLATRVQIL
jgi:hypothetical protein